MRKVCRIHKINCMNAFRFKFFYYFNKPFGGDWFTFVFVTYGIILTKATFQTASWKENCTCTFFTADTRFFPIMNIGTSKNRIQWHFTESITCIFSSFCITISRTKITEHIFHQLSLFNCTTYLLDNQTVLEYNVFIDFVRWYYASYNGYRKYQY